MRRSLLAAAVVGLVGVGLAPNPIPTAGAVEPPGSGTAGCFAAAATYLATALTSGGSGSTSQAVEVDGDGHVDLVVADPIGLGVNVLLNRGDGTFGLPQHTWTGYDSYAVNTGDFDGDGV